MAETVKGVLKPKTFDFEWKIKRFFANCKKVGDFYKSPAFPIHYQDKMTSWYLKVYPKGIREEFKDSVSLYLCFQSENVSKVTVDYKLTIVSEQNNLSLIDKAITFKGPASNWGWHEFVKQDVIKDTKNGALIDDTLTILCEITFHQVAQDVTETFHGYDEWLDKTEKQFIKYENLLHTNRFSDVTFNIQGTKLYLHKAIIVTSGSPIFQAMFEDDMKEKKHSSVDITDVDYEIMKELFRFIYSGKVENIKKIAKDLLIVADRYSVTGLKALCEKTLYDNLTVDNAIECLKLTDEYDTIHLNRLVNEFIENNWTEVVKQPEFEKLPSRCVRKIIKNVAVKESE